MGAGASVESLNINGLAEVRTAGIARIPAHMALRILPLFQAAEAKGMPSIVTDTIRNNEIDGSKALALNADTIDDLTKNDPDRMELKVALRSGRGCGAAGEPPLPPERAGGSRLEAVI